MLPESLGRRSRSVARRHSYSFFSSLGALLDNRLGTLMTILVLGIAMLLPVSLHLTLINLDRLELQEDQWSTLNVFMQEGVAADAVRTLATELETLDTVQAVEVISPEQGLAEFREAAGFAALDLLESNPLPWVLSVQPTPGDGLENRVEALAEILRDRELVEQVAYDQNWLERLDRLLGLGRAVVNVLAVLFGLAVIVVVANTIRMDVSARAEEIEVLALLGAWPAFIRQPFLYSGLWYGLLGGVMAMILINLGLEYLEGPVSRFLASYGQETSLVGLGLVQTLVLLASGALLGLLGAWAAVARHLRTLRYQVSP